jgi:hypothetical protein
MYCKLTVLKFIRNPVFKAEERYMLQITLYLALANCKLQLQVLLYYYYLTADTDFMVTWLHI